MTNRRYLITGGAGFIGSNFVRRHLAERPGDAVVVLDSLSYAGNPENLAGLAERYPQYRFVRGDVAAAADVETAFEVLKSIDREGESACAPEGAGAGFVVAHFAAESHVDRSIDDPAPFVHTNVVGTQVLLEASRRRGVERFLQVSTDEVYGSLGAADAAFSEATPLAPNSPYAASKAGADCLARAYFHTYELPVLITRCSNNYGPYQFPEKFLPLFITNAFDARPLPLYGDGQNVRDWLHVDDHCAALELVIDRGVAGEVYNIGGACERKNLEVAQAVCRATGRSESLIRLVADRRGHDRRYAIDASKIERALGWRPQHALESDLAALVDWYREHRPWWEAIKSGAYREYYSRRYGQDYQNEEVLKR